MKTSARNQLSGEIAGISRGVVNAEVQIRLASGQTFIALITLESVRALGIGTGSTVTALFKSSWVVLGTGIEAPRVSTRNKLKGKVKSVVEGAVHSEVVLDLGGTEIVSTITNGSVEALGIVPGADAWALIKASSVILAV